MWVHGGYMNGTAGFVTCDLCWKCQNRYGMWVHGGYMNGTAGFETCDLCWKCQNRYGMWVHRHLNWLAQQDWGTRGCSHCLARDRKIISYFWIFKDFPNLWFLNEIQRLRGWNFTCLLLFFHFTKCRKYLYSGFAV